MASSRSALLEREEALPVGSDGERVAGSTPGTAPRVVQAIVTARRGELVTDRVGPTTPPAHRRRRGNFEANPGCFSRAAGVGALGTVGAVGLVLAVGRAWRRRGRRRVRG